MTAVSPKVLVVAEAANPEWVSVPLVGWSHCRALAEVADVHVVTQIRNQAAMERAGWLEGREFTALDTEGSAAPLYALNEWLRRVTGLGWTLTTALSALPYYHFEYELVRRFGADLDAGKYALVHRVTPLSPTTPSSFLISRCKKARVPFVWGPVNGGVPWPKQFRDVQRAEGEWLSHVRSAYKLLPGYRQTLKQATALIAGSVSVWEQFSGHHDRCVYMPENAVDPTRFDTLRQPYSGGPLRVAFVGRLVPYKGADILIEAAAPLVRAAKLELDIIGDGPEMQNLKALVTELGVEAGVRLEGWVPHERLSQRLSGAQVFGFPSLREFGGGVVLETMAMGLVPVVVAYAGPNELVTDQTGFRVPLGSRESIVSQYTKVLSELAADPSRLEPIAARARQRVLDHFTWSAKARQTLEVYRWVLGERSKPDFGMPFPDAAH